MLDVVLDQIPDAALLAPLLALLAGALLTVSPIALPSVPVVVSAVAPGTITEGGRRSEPLLRSAPSVLAFVAGMDGMLGIFGAVIIELSDFLTRAGIILHLTSAALLGTLGLRLLLRRSSLCQRAGTLPPNPVEAFTFGVFFGVAGCPACAPIAIGVGAAAGIVAGPAIAFAVIAAFVVGRAASLLVLAAVGARFLPTDTDQAGWRRVDLVIGWIFMVIAAYYLYRVLSGAVVTSLPGEPGGGLP